MKCLKIAFLIGSLVMGMSSCKKDKDNDANSIVGMWELRKTSAAMNPVIATYPPGNGRIIKFTNDAYYIYEAGQLKKSGQYTVQADGSVQESVCLNISSEEYDKIIVYDGNTNITKQFFKIEQGALKFIAGCYAYDAGHTEEYAKMSPDKDNP